jgi:LuxR family quorum-sensing system transcriptional regulator CciR
VSRLSDVNAFIGSSRACRTPDDLRRLMEDITWDMGFSAYALFQHVQDLRLENRTVFALSNYPRGWLRYYFQHKLKDDDPVNLASYRTSVGFRFSDIPSLIDLTERQRQILESARREGIADGFCVPAHVPGETAGSCTFVVSQAGALPEHNLPMAQLVGSFAYEAGRRIHARVCGREDGYGSEADRHRPTITTRQLECLVLVARGKSDWEIGRILGIGQETVKHHIRVARERYEVGTRIQAAIRAIADGEIDIRDIAR